MLELKPMALEDLDAIRPYLLDRSSLSCDDSPMDMLMWRAFFAKSWTSVQDSLVVHMIGYDQQPSFMVPLGGSESSRAAALSEIRSYARTTGEPLRFMAALEEDLAWLEAQGVDFTTETDEAWWDYIYDAQAMVQLPGNAFRTQRNHINRFERDNLTYTFEPLTAENREAVRAFYDQVDRDKADRTPLLDEEHIRIHELLDHLELYQPLTGVLSIGPSVLGFTIGEVVGETLLTHVEKARTDIPGTYAMLTNLFNSQVLDAHPDLRYINREEDMGDLGLRQAKQSYNPIRMLKKYLVRVTA